MRNLGNKGLSIVEVLVASGMALVVSLAVMKMNQSGMQGASAVGSKVSLRMWQSTVLLRKLSDPEIAMHNLGGISPATGGTRDDLVNLDDTPFMSPGEVIDGTSGSWRLQAADGIQLDPFVPDDVGSNRGQSILTIHIENTKKNYAAQKMSLRIPISCTLDGAGTAYESCAATAGSGGDSLWALQLAAGGNPEYIWSNRNVMVGDAAQTSTAPLQVQLTSGDEWPIAGSGVTQSARIDGNSRAFIFDNVGFWQESDTCLWIGHFDTPTFRRNNFLCPTFAAINSNNVGITGAFSTAMSAAVSQISGSNSVASGTQHNVQGNSAHVSGTNQIVQGNNTLVAGNVNRVNGNNSFAVGDDNEVHSINSGAFGKSNDVISGSNSLAIGDTNAISSDNSFISGFANAVSGDNSFASGRNHNVQGNFSFVAGQDSSIQGTHNHGFGQRLVANGNDNFLAGYRVESEGNNNVLIGSHILSPAGANNTVVMGFASDANELIPNASSDTFTAAFNNGYIFRTNSAGGVTPTTSVFINSTGGMGVGVDPATMGGGPNEYVPRLATFGNVRFKGNRNEIGTHASARNADATAIGPGRADRPTIASGQYSVAIGMHATASGRRSIALGVNNARDPTVSAGVASFAVGHNSEAGGDYAFVIGKNFRAGEEDSFMIGNSPFALVAPEGARETTVYGENGVTVCSDTTGTAEAAGPCQGGLKMVGSAWGPPSDRNLKENFEDLNPEEFLRRFKDLPVTIWSYKNESKSGIRTIGPVAQDFEEAFSRDFKLRSTDTRIFNSDIRGVLMMTVKALIQRNEDLEAENEELKNRLDRIEAKLNL